MCPPPPCSADWCCIKCIGVNRAWAGSSEVRCDDVTGWWLGASEGARERERARERFHVWSGTVNSNRTARWVDSVEARPTIQRVSDAIRWLWKCYLFLGDTVLNFTMTYYLFIIHFGIILSRSCETFSTFKEGVIVIVWVRKKCLSIVFLS